MANCLIFLTSFCEKNALYLRTHYHFFFFFLSNTKTRAFAQRLKACYTALIMNTAYKKWLPYIERDLRVAQKLYRSTLRDKSNNWYDWMFIIWNCHQVTEKSLKMIIIAKDIELPYIRLVP
jgi:hypothetical protein